MITQGQSPRRTLDQTLAWTRVGTDLVLGQLTALSARQWDEPSLLPGWRRRELAAHLAANADAIGNLVHWAATGVETPMYASPQARAEGIADGARRSPEELIGWTRASAEALAAAMTALTAAAWSHPVLTAQGRTVPASETPWMRAREVLVHAVDLGCGVGFSGLPADFLLALGDDVCGKRGLNWTANADTLHGSPANLEVPSGAGDSSERIHGPLADVAAYLTGRPHGELATASGDPLPDLPPWL